MINKLDNKLTQQINAIFAAWDRPDSPGCALAITQGDEVVYARGYGSAQLEYGIPITPTTVFHVASVSKQFTAMCIALLADDGLLDLEAPIQEYLPEVPDFGHKITLNHLVHHTSGMRDQWELLVAAGWRWDDVITKDHIMKMVRRQRELNFEPGAEYLYCNTGYTLMAETVQRVSGKSLREFADERIFRPLGMHNTHFHDDHEEIVKNRAYSYAPRLTGGWRKSILSYANVGATSLFTTAEDLTKWLFNFDHGQVGGPAVLKQMHERFVLNDGETIPYGFGLMFAEHKGLQEVGHSGADAGFRSWCGRILPHGLGIVVLSNLATSGPRDLSRRVAEVMLADHLVVEEAAPAKIEAKAADYTGEYLLPYLGQKIVVSLAEDTLLAAMEGETEHELTYRDVDHYQLPKAEVVFARDEQGEVNQLTLQHRGLNMTAKRMPDYTLSATELAEFVGEYYSPELDTTYRLRLHGNELVAVFQRHPDVVLVPWGPDVFQRQSSPEGELKFTRDAEQKITGFRLSGGRIRHVLFNKQS